MDNTLEDIQEILARMEEHNIKNFEQMMKMLETIKNNTNNK